MSDRVNHDQLHIRVYGELDRFLKAGGDRQDAVDVAVECLATLLGLAKEELEELVFGGENEENEEEEDEENVNGDDDDDDE